MRAPAANLRETTAPPPGLLIVGRYDEGPAYAVRRSGGATNWLLLWTESGGGQVRQGTARALAGPGDLVVLAPGVRHLYRTDPAAGRWGFWWVHFQPRSPWAERLRRYDLGDGCHVVAGVDPGARPAVSAALRQAHADSRWTGEGAPPRPARAGGRGARASVAGSADAAALAAVDVERVLLLTTAGAGSSVAGDPRIRRALALIDADPATGHTVASLAAAVALSPSRFARLFAEQTGTTPMRALREARLRHAGRLLRGTALPVARVAEASGFAGAFHFSHVFRRRYGVPPRDYRTGGDGRERGRLPSPPPTPEEPTDVTRADDTGPA